VQFLAADRAVQDGPELPAAAGVGEQRGRSLGRAEPPVASVQHDHDVREEGAALVVSRYSTRPEVALVSRVSSTPIRQKLRSRSVPIGPGPSYPARGCTVS
jgi:hypothetical protein